MARKQENFRVYIRPCRKRFSQLLWVVPCEPPKEAWEKIKEDFDDNHPTKLMEIYP